jgi:hypothetical protein
MIVDTKVKSDPVAFSQDPISVREISFRIPIELVKEFGEETRIVIRHPWLIGIPIPERLRPEILKGIKDFEAIIVPRQL